MHILHSRGSFVHTWPSKHIYEDIKINQQIVWMKIFFLCVICISLLLGWEWSYLFFFLLPTLKKNSGWVLIPCFMSCYGGHLRFTMNTNNIHFCSQVYLQKGLLFPDDNYLKKFPILDFQPNRNLKQEHPIIIHKHFELNKCF